MSALANSKLLTVAFALKAAINAVRDEKIPMVVLTLNAVSRFDDEHTSALAELANEMTLKNGIIVISSDLSTQKDCDPEEIEMFADMDRLAAELMIRNYGLPENTKFWAYNNQPEKFQVLGGEENADLHNKSVITIIYDGEEDVEELASLLEALQPAAPQNALQLDVSSSEFLSLQKMPTLEVVQPSGTA